MKKRQRKRGVLVALAVAGTLTSAGCRPPEPPEEAATPVVAVEVGRVTRATLRARLEVYGTVEPKPAGPNEPGGAAVLASPIAGIVTDVAAAEGDLVEAGALVVKLDDRVALAALEKARVALAFAQQQMDRQEKLKALADSSERAVQEAAALLAAAHAEVAGAEAQLALVQLRSPLAGIVARINARPGQAVDLNTVLAEIIDPARLVVEAAAPSAEAGRIRVGQRAEITFTADESEGLEGEVVFISPRVDPRTSATRVRIALPAQAGLSPGRLARVKIVTEERRDCLAVPLASLYTDESGQTVLSLVQGDTAHRQVVTVGPRDGDLVEVTGLGVEEGAEVVTVGSYALPDGAQVQVSRAPAGP